MITVNILALVLVYKSFCNTVCIYGHANKAGCCCSACIYFVETPLESRYKPRAIFQRQWGVGCGGGGLKFCDERNTGLSVELQTTKQTLALQNTQLNLLTVTSLAGIHNK